jgi:hypothetical protein
MPMQEMSMQDKQKWYNEWNAAIDAAEESFKNGVPYHTIKENIPSKFDPTEIIEEAIESLKEKGIVAVA